jgi:dTDP-4-dehydrorhamnose reductase
VFGPWDETDELARALRMLSIGAIVSLPSDELASPTYLPDLVNESLDLLLDGERGIWHLANRGQASPHELVDRVATLAGINTASLRAVSGATLHRPAHRPASRILGSERGEHLPLLDDALARYVTACTTPSSTEEIAEVVDALGTV